MKKLFILIIVLSITGFSCNKKCGVDKPKNIKPIDWENYNDVHTVKWNFRDDCSKFPLGRTGKTIKMYGWIFHPQSVNPYLFALLSDSLFVEADNPKCAMVYVICDGDREECTAISSKINSSDSKRKCYVMGELSIDHLAGNTCCTSEPEILLKSSDDIYFE